MLTNHRVKGESARAHAAFIIYRDLGPGRSLDAAWQKHTSNRGATCASTKCPGQWRDWSARFQWVERALESDRELAAFRREALADRMRQRDQVRAEREIEYDTILWESMLDMNGTLKKLSSAPITDVTQSREEVVSGKSVKTINKVKGINLPGYARLVTARNETGRQAIVGVREQPPAPDDDHVVDRVVLKTNRQD